MKLIDSSERLKILFLVSDQLWDDLISGELQEEEYTVKIDEIRLEMRKEINSSFLDLQNIASKIGYILTKKQKAFGLINSYVIARN